MLAMDDGEIRWHKPVAYQEKNGARQEIAAHYVVKGGNRVGFEIADYDSRRPLFIDPLIYSTYLGGSGLDQGNGIAVDSSGNAYVTGTTFSPDFPTMNPLQPTLGGAGAANAFVAKLNPTGSALVYSTYLGGSGEDIGLAIAVDNSGIAYFTGQTSSTNFPTMNPLQPTYPGGEYTAFVAKLNPAGSALVYSTYLGGSGDDSGNGIAVDGSGNAYVTGTTASTDFPTMNPFQPAYGGDNDAFVAKLNPTGSALVYSTYLGGSGYDEGYGIAVDNLGDAYVTGYTASTNFPTVNPLQPAYGGGEGDAFVAEVNPAGSALVYSTYLGGSGQDNLGGSGQDNGFGVAVDSSGNAYVTGYTDSTNFPTMNPLQPALGGEATNAFVAKISPCVSVTPTAVFLDSTSQSGPPLSVVTTGPRCLWVASANAAFIDITSGASGDGNGTVTFSVPANTTGADLTGTLSVGGQAVSITQRETAVTFTDVPPSNGFFDFINTMYERGITAGCATSPLQYCPDSTTTRAEMAVFIITGIEGGDTFSYTTTPYFTDVPPTDPFFKFIQKMKDLGITSGCAATMYCPDDPVTRGEMAVFIILGRYGAIDFTALPSYSATQIFSDVPPSSSFYPFIQEMAEAGITAGCGSGMYCPNELLTRGQMAVFIITGLLNQLLPAATPLIASATPNAAAPGQAVTLTLSGVNTNFVQGATQVTMVPGITPSGIVVSSATSLTVQVAVSPGAAPGPTSIVVTTGTEQAVLPNGFTVQ